MNSRLPGYEESPRTEPREVLRADQGTITAAVVVDGELAVDGSSPTESYDLRAGWLMGRVTATRRWTPCKRTRVANSTESSSAAGSFTHFSVENAAPFRVGDVITVGANTGLTITAVNYADQRLTVDDNINVTDDEAVFAEDGSATCRGILLNFVRLRSKEGSVIHRPATLLVQGLVQTGQILGDLAAVRADTNSQLAGILFTDQQGLD